VEPTYLKTPWTCLDLFWICFGSVLDLFWICFGSVLDLFQIFFWIRCWVCFFELSLELFLLYSGTWYFCTRVSIYGTNVVFSPGLCSALSGSVKKRQHALLRLVEIGSSKQW